MLRGKKKKITPKLFSICLQFQIQLLYSLSAKNFLVNPWGLKGNLWGQHKHMWQFHRIWGWLLPTGTTLPPNEPGLVLQVTQTPLGGWRNLMRRNENLLGAVPSSAPTTPIRQPLRQNNFIVAASAEWLRESRHIDHPYFLFRGGGGLIACPSGPSRPVSGHVNLNM